MRRTKAAPGNPAKKAARAATKAADTRAIRTPFNGPNITAEVRPMSRGERIEVTGGRRFFVSLSALALFTVVVAMPAIGTTHDGEEFGGVVTSSGIPVAVESSSGLLHRVTTPCGNPAWVVSTITLEEVQVVIDPGHGGPIDTGAVGPNGLAEKDVNLVVAKAAAKVLDDRGITTVLTRTGDYASPLSVRAGFADSVGAEVMVSIHHNAPTPGPSDAPGTEVFIQQGSGESHRLGGLLWEHAMAGLGIFDVEWSAAADAGVMTVLSTRGVDAYGIIRFPDTPTALIELGYISSEAEAALFANILYPWVAGRAIAGAIEEYLTSDSSGAGHVEGRVFNPLPGVGRSVCADPSLSVGKASQPANRWQRPFPS